MDNNPSTILDEDFGTIVDVLQKQFMAPTSPSNDTLAHALLDALREKDRLNDSVSEDSIYAIGSADERELWEEACGLAAGYWWSTEADSVISTIQERVKERREGQQAEA